MTITVNGKLHPLDSAQTIEQLLATLDYGDRRVAVAVNQTFVPRSEYSAKTLQEGDDVEIVAPMPGG